MPVMCWMGQRNRCTCHRRSPNQSRWTGDSVIGKENPHGPRRRLLREKISADSAIFFIQEVVREEGFAAVSAKPENPARDTAAQYPAGLPRRSCASCDTGDSSPFARKAKNGWQSLCWSSLARSTGLVAARAASGPACVASSRTAAPLFRFRNTGTAPCTLPPDKLLRRHAPRALLPPLRPRKRHPTGIRSCPRARIVGILRGSWPCPAAGCVFHERPRALPASSADPHSASP